MGIDTSQLAGVTDGGSAGDTTKFNSIDGTNPVSGSGEALTFSFDHAGVLKTLLFDGVKDETLEYVSLTLPNGTQLTIFDSQTEYRLNLQGFHLTDLQVPNPVQAQTEDDDLTGINFSFLAGEVFTLTYGEGDYDDVPGYSTFPNIPEAPNIPGNGALLQGVVVAVPEPCSALLGSLLMANVLLWQRPRLALLDKWGWSSQLAGACKGLSTLHMSHACLHRHSHSSGKASDNQGSTGGVHSSGINSSPSTVQSAKYTSREVSSLMK